MSEKRDRRDFLKAAAVGVAGAAGAPLLMGEAAAAGSSRMNPNAKAVMPNGKEMSRADILSTLGLDPGTAPDAWLTIVACGSNASALTARSKEQLMKKGVLDAKQLKGMEMQMRK